MHYLIWILFALGMFFVILTIVLLLKWLIGRARGLAEALSIDFKRALFVIVLINIFPFNLFAKLLKRCKRVVIIGSLPKIPKKKLLIVSNHP